MKFAFDLAGDQKLAGARIDRMSAGRNGPSSILVGFLEGTRRQLLDDAVEEILGKLDFGAGRARPGESTVQPKPTRTIHRLQAAIGPVSPKPCAGVRSTRTGISQDRTNWSPRLPSDVNGRRSNGNHVICTEESMTWEGAGANDFGVSLLSFGPGSSGRLICLNPWRHVRTCPLAALPPRPVPRLR